MSGVKIYSGTLEPENNAPIMSGYFITLDDFIEIIDCLYEYDLGEELPAHWPPGVRRLINQARSRLS